MTENFYTILTSVGKAKFANAQTLGTKVNITSFAVGDGNGAYYNPVDTQTALKKEVWRGTISKLSTDQQNPNWIVIETVIPSTVGGFMVREAAIFDDTGAMIAIGKYPETYKPVVSEGSAKDLFLRMILEITNLATVTLKIDPAVALATRKDIDNLAGAGRTTQTIKDNADAIAVMKGSGPLKEKADKEYVDAQIVEVSNDMNKPEYSTPLEITSSIIPISESCVEGQLRASVLGNSIFNHADNGTDYSKWTIIGTGVTKGANGIHLLSSNGSKSAALPTKLNGNKEYTLVFNIKNKQGNGAYAQLMIAESLTGASILISNLKTGSLGLVKLKITTQSTITTNELKTYVLSDDVTDFVDFEIYGIIEGDQTTNAGVNKPFKYGANSTLSTRVRSIGKNLFDKSKAKKGFRISSSGNDEINAIYAITDYIPVLPNSGYAKSHIYNSPADRIAFYDRNKNLISFNTFTSQQFTTPSSAFYIRTNLTIETIDTFQIENGNVATTYEPYVSTEAYYPEVGRSLLNGIKDEINEKVEKIQRVNQYVLQSSDIASLNTTGTNDWVVCTNVADKFPLPAYTPWDLGVDGKVDVIGKTECIGSTIELNKAENIGKFGTDQKTIYFPVAKGTYVDLNAAKTAFTGTVLNYQLAQEVKTIINAKGLNVYPGGALYVEFIIGDVGFYTTAGVKIRNVNRPIKRIDAIYKIDKSTGSKTYLDVALAVVSPDKLGFTHPACVDGDLIDYDYEYDSESTLPTIRYSVPMNRGAQADGNTRSIERIDMKLAEHIQQTNVQLEKHGHIEATPTAAGFMSAVDKTKLDGLSNYSHPATHSPSIIVQDVNNRFVTDTEKAAWNGKSDSGHGHGSATPTVAGFMSAADKTKLNGVADGANNYVLPTADAATLGGVKLKTGVSMVEDGLLVWILQSRYDTGNAQVQGGVSSTDIVKFVSNTIVKARIDSTGKGYFNGGTQTSGADYAEFFEWQDGNPNAEDRCGYFVTFGEEDKIKIFDGSSDYVLGIVTGTAAILADDYEFAWKNKYLMDDLGRVLFEDVVVYDKETETDIIVKMPIENPEYNTVQEYIPRSKRAEWAPIGLVGKLYVYDDGTCVPGGYCRPNTEGKATSALDGYKVMQRVNENIIRILLK